MNLDVHVDVSLLRNVAGNAPELFSRFIKKIAIAVEGEAVLQVTGKSSTRGARNKAVDTGNLSRSPASRTGRSHDGAYGEVYSHVPYAQHVHDGTNIKGAGFVMAVKSGTHRGMRPRPYFKHAIQDVITTGNFARIFEAVTGKWIGRGVQSAISF